MLTSIAVVMALNPIAGALFGVIDAFVPERPFLTPGPVAFLNRQVSIFKDARST
jgi:hypothetical protein